MEKVLKYFTIDGAVGGSQAWFSNVVMNMGGCAAVTACDSSIYFALHRGCTEICPFAVQALTREEYVRFGMKMKPYLKPRVEGVKELSMFIDGYRKISCRCRGERALYGSVSRRTYLFRSREISKTADRCRISDPLSAFTPQK